MSKRLKFGTKYYVEYEIAGETARYEITEDEFHCRYPRTVTSKNVAEESGVIVTTEIDIPVEQLRFVKVMHWMPKPPVPDSEPSEVDK